MTGFTRRGVLAATAIGGAGLTLPAFATQTAAAGLNAAARAKGMRFGSCFAWGPPGADRGSFANPAYAALLERDCGILVPENEMKWQALRPDAKTFNVERFPTCSITPRPRAWRCAATLCCGTRPNISPNG